ncbi:hypothetical protein [Luteolibacter sp. Populi]|uniref:hypothetical protein n=1 Tax=Luteolibacter sp. Populi TaxID=3230487 RepID=UPI0034660465
MKPRSSSIAFLACLGVVIAGIILWMFPAESPREGSDSAASRAAKSDGRAPTNDPHAAERAATRRAREALREDPRLKAIWVEGSLENAAMRDLLEPFNPSELRRMLDNGGENEWKLTGLLMRAGAEKHPGFQDLLARPELRANPAMDMALCAYDYSLNGNREALERIVAAYRAAGAAGEGRWNDPAWQALECVDEWDLAKQALLSHPMGSGGDSDFDPQLSFWLTRRYLFPMNRDFPEDYDRFTEDLIRRQGQGDAPEAKER